MAIEFKYFESDGSYFRRRASLNFPVVEEVRQAGQWVPYKGDRRAPVTYGDEVTAEEAGDAG